MKWITLFATGFCSLFLAIDFTIVNTSLSVIQRELHASLGQLQWMMAGFGIAFCPFLVTMGRLGDRYGRRKLLYFGVGVFGLASLGAGLSQTPLQLIIYRLFQGVSAAVVFPCGMALTAAAFPEGERGRALGIFGGIIGVGLAIGPVLGGAILTIASWRWIFLINVPGIIFGFLICVFAVKESKSNVITPIDWKGVAILTLALAILVFAVTEAPTFGWTSPWIISLLVISPLLFVWFGWVERKTEAPLLPFSLFRDSGFLLGTLVNIVGVSFAWPVTFLIPLYLQNALAFTPAVAGLTLLPMTIMTAIAPPFAGYWYDKKGPRRPVLLLFFCAIGAFVLQLFIGSSATMVVLIFALITYGTAWGIANGIAIPLALSHLASTDQAGVVTGATVTALNIFAVISLSVSGTLFRHLQTIAYRSNIVLHTSLFKQSYTVGYRGVMGLLLFLSLILLIAAIYLLKKENHAISV